jgi:hypothetical protein
VMLGHNTRDCLHDSIRNHHTSSRLWVSKKVWIVETTETSFSVKFWIIIAYTSVVLE